MPLFPLTLPEGRYPALLHYTDPSHLTDYSNNTIWTVSELAESGFTGRFERGCDLGRCGFAPAPQGRGWRETWRETVGVSVLM